MRLLWPCAEGEQTAPTTGAQWPRALFGLDAARGGAHDGVYVGWLTGAAARAVSGRPSAELTAELRAGLSAFWPQLSCELVSCVATAWAANRHYGGSYSFPLRGAPADVADVLAEPLVRRDGGGDGGEGEGEGGRECGDAEPRVLFCGEATSARHFGTVHGAIESGTREAVRFLGILGEHRHE